MPGVEAVFEETEITQTMIFGVVLDLAVIPRPYVISHHAVKRGGRWKRKA
jgi:hypothetical protein